MPVTKSQRVPRTAGGTAPSTPTAGADDVGLDAACAVESPVLDQRRDRAARACGGRRDAGCAGAGVAGASVAACRRAPLRRAGRWGRCASRTRPARAGVDQHHPDAVGLVRRPRTSSTRPMPPRTHRTARPRCGTSSEPGRHCRAAADAAPAAGDLARPARAGPGRRRGRTAGAREPWAAQERDLAAQRASPVVPPTEVTHGAGWAA